MANSQDSLSASCLLTQGGTCRQGVTAGLCSRSSFQMVAGFPAAGALPLAGCAASALYTASLCLSVFICEMEAVTVSRESWRGLGE